jgi:hypothetical protein
VNGSVVAQQKKIRGVENEKDIGFGLVVLVGFGFARFGG